jgi:hypothetical protein
VRTVVAAAAAAAAAVVVVVDGRRGDGSQHRFGNARSDALVANVALQLVKQPDGLLHAP